MLYKWQFWWCVYHAWVADTLARSFWSFSYPLYVITISMYATTCLFLRHHFGVYIYIYYIAQTCSGQKYVLKIFTCPYTTDMGKMKKKKKDSTRTIAKNIFTSCDTAFFCIWNFFIYIILVREKQLSQTLTHSHVSHE